MTEIEFLSNYILQNSEESSNIITENTRENIEVYKTNYEQSLLLALERKYPTLKKVLERNFAHFALKFILKNKSKKNNIDSYGDSFPSFISREPKLKHMAFIEYIGEIDLIWYNMDTRSKKKLPKGSLKAWRDINDSKFNSIEIDENQSETIEVKIQEDSFYIVSS